MGGGVDGSVVTPPPHGESSRVSSATDPGGRRFRRGAGDIRGVLPMGTEVGGISGRQFPGEGEQPREDQVTLHVSALEVEGVDSAGWTGTTTTIQSMRDACSSGTTGEAQADG